MRLPRRRHSILLLACLAGPAVAGDTAPDARGASDQILVVARDVMPRIAYRGLEPSANPASVTALLFPGRVFRGSLDGMLGALVGEDALGDTAPVLPTTGLREPRMLQGEMIEPRSAAPLGGGASAAGAGGGLGATVLGATAGLADTVTRAVMPAGVGP